MGTRGAFGVIIGEQEKIGYNQFDSYPSGWGISNLAWLREADLDEIRHKAENLLVVSNETGRPTPEQIDFLRKYSDDGVSEQSLDDWYCLLYETHGQLKEILDCGYIEDAREFPLHSLFCEWAYMLDLDLGVFEVYKGFQDKPHKEGRFAARKPEHPTNGYYPVRLVGAWQFDQLPSDEEFLALAVAEEEED